MILPKKPTSRKKKFLAFAIIGISLIIGAYQALTTESNVRKIKDDAGTAVAEVTNWTINAKSKGITITYAFTDGSSTYFGDAVYSPLTVIKDKPVNAHFPVVYSKEDPQVSHLLITEKDYKKFGEAQPDSLVKYNALFE